MISLFATSPLALGVPPRHVLERVIGSELNLMEADPLQPSSGPQMSVAGQPFSAFNVALLSQVTPQSFSTNATCSASSTNVCANDIWGYVSPSGREYAIIGLRTGTGFVDVTDPTNPVVVGAISDANSIWSDMRTYLHFGYNVNESGGGLQVFNLFNIDPPARQVTLVRSITQSGLSTSHNLTLNPDSATLYLCGANLGGGRLVALSLADPSFPTIVGQMVEGVYVHDAQVISYTEGPYAGREIAFCFCGSAGLRIVDVTDKSNMFTMASLVYPNLSYCHQGGVSEDRRYLFIDDELDELNRPSVTTTTTYLVNIENLSAPQFVTTFTSGQPTIDHNLFVRGDYVFEANYTSGLRIFDVRDPQNAVQVGWFDTYTFNNGMNFNGSWGVWPYLPSGNVLVSDMQGGLFVLDPSAAVAGPCQVANAPAIGPDPTPRNRYLAVSPANAGQQTALRLKLVDLPPPFEAAEGSYQWVQLPENIVDTINPVTTIQRSRLGCEPVYADWGAVGPIVIADRAIVPGGAYEVQQIGVSCDIGAEADYSAGVAVATSVQWGDLVGADPSGPPEGDTNFVDVSAVVNKFKQASGSVGVDRADLSPDVPDGKIDFSDISVDLNAFKGVPYPFAGPIVCP